MSESPPPSFADRASGDAAEALTPERIEAVVADFRSWLHQAATPPPVPSLPAHEPIDLYTLLAQFTALRHEVNLQTKGMRAQQEQNAETVQQLDQALTRLEQAHARAQAADSEALEEQLRPLLKILVDVADALALGRREVQRVRETIWTALERLQSPPEPVHPEATASAGGFLARWFGGREEASGPVVIQPRHALPSEETIQLIRQLLESLLTGYTMSVQRAERALHQAGLEPIPTVGEPFDPERMEVMEAVTDSGLPPGEVLDEIRRGYFWKGRVFRYALVRVAKS